MFSPVNPAGLALKGYLILATIAAKTAAGTLFWHQQAIDLRTHNRENIVT